MRLQLRDPSLQVVEAVFVGRQNLIGFVGRDPVE